MVLLEPYFNASLEASIGDSKCGHYLIHVHRSGHDTKDRQHRWKGIDMVQGQLR